VTLKQAFDEATKYLRETLHPNARVSRFCAYRKGPYRLTLEEDRNGRFSLEVGGEGDPDKLKLPNLSVEDIKVMFSTLKEGKPYAHQHEGVLYNVLPGTREDVGLGGVVVFDTQAHRMVKTEIPMTVIKSLAASLFDLDCLFTIEGMQAGLNVNGALVIFNHEHRFAFDVVEGDEFPLSVQEAGYVLKAVGTILAAVASHR